MVHAQRVVEAEQCLCRLSAVRLVQPNREIHQSLGLPLNDKEQRFSEFPSAARFKFALPDGLRASGPAICLLPVISPVVVSVESILQMGVGPGSTRISWLLERRAPSPMAESGAFSGGRLPTNRCRRRVGKPIAGIDLGGESYSRDGTRGV